MTDKLIQEPTVLEVMKCRNITAEELAEMSKKFPFVVEPFEVKYGEV